MRKIFNIIKENILEIILLVLISLFSISIIDKSVTNDTFTAILNGNYIINTGNVDEKEVFTFNDSLKFIKLRWAFDVIVAKFKSALIIPITGFAHSITSAAIDYKNEGLVLGIGSNIFKLAGTVILYGEVSVYIFGLIRILLGGI